MKLGLFLDYASARLTLPVERVQLAERLGFDSVWSAEAYGSDAITPLAYLAAQTERIRLGTGIAQIAGRAPAMAAMQIGHPRRAVRGRPRDRRARTLGTADRRGLVRTAVGQALATACATTWRSCARSSRREGPVSHEGREISAALPRRRDALGIGKPLKSILHMNPDIPIWLGTGSETNVQASPPRSRTAGCPWASTRA